MRRLTLAPVTVPAGHANLVVATGTPTSSGTTSSATTRWPPGHGHPVATGPGHTVPGHGHAPVTGTGPGRTVATGRR